MLPQWNRWSTGGLYFIPAATAWWDCCSHYEGHGRFPDLDCFKFTIIFQWPHLIPQPYPLTPYGGLPQHFSGAPAANQNPSLRARSLPSGGTARRTRGTFSERGRSQGSNPSKSKPRSSRSRNAKPYDNPEQARDVKIFNDVVWDLARKWFVCKLWRESCFFLKANEEDPTVDRCAIEAYEAAISDYRETYPEGAALISQHRLQPQGTIDLAKCRQMVSGYYSHLVWLMNFWIYSSYFQLPFYTWTLLSRLLVRQWPKSMVLRVLLLQEKVISSKNSLNLHYVMMCLTTPVSKRSWWSYFLRRLIAGVEA